MGGRHPSEQGLEHIYGTFLLTLTTKRSTAAKAGWEGEGREGKDPKQKLWYVRTYQGLFTTGSVFAQFSRWLFRNGGQVRNSALVPPGKPCDIGTNVEKYRTPPLQRATLPISLSDLVQSFAIIYLAGRDKLVCFRSLLLFCTGRCASSLPHHSIPAINFLPRSWPSLADDGMTTTRTQEDLVDRHDKLKNAIANLSSKYQKDVGELTYACAQEAKRCGFEVNLPW